MNKLQIIIIGERGAGKTTVAQFVEKCLNQVGIETKLDDSVGLIVTNDVAADRAAKIEDTFQPRLLSLVGREEFVVEIATQEQARSSILRG